MSLLLCMNGFEYLQCGCSIYPLLGVCAFARVFACAHKNLCVFLSVCLCVFVCMQACVGVYLL